MPRILNLLLCILLFACSSSTSQENIIEVEKAFPNLRFTRPVDFQQPSNGKNQVYVVEQAGKIYLFKNEKSVKNKVLFLDITDKVDDGGNEEGLLGLAFHPDYKTNGYFFVNYTASSPSRSVIARFQAGQGSIISTTEKTILEYAQPYSNHNGGQIIFGPDGYLYIAIGDGGSGGDPKGNGQNRKTLLGSIVRIDVDKQENGRNYAIPSDNPFAGNKQGYREEIFAYGLRNPWRFCFNPQNGQLWAADVGQYKLEEIDIIQKGGNYGWNYMEGSDCYGSSEDCDTPGLIRPIFEYHHSVGQSITGGRFYQHSEIEELQNAYIYGDFVAGKIWALYFSDGRVQKNQLITTEINGIASFGEDFEKQLYVLSFDGYIYRFKSK
ncbi:MAG: glucose sorbosone dehydrogenase [Calditrichaeota bacterium]|nr:MAG: glucose sorbosone dehydrogenase [Calditrichota bacterium]MBL1205804.1 glucose sorbosone dehydrogenase [Calditrichota bacterium]NOG45632.1 glucose sorbosone dehydrogenase [Calditrichota bacterium]